MGSIRNGLVVPISFGFARHFSLLGSGSKEQQWLHSDISCDQLTKIKLLSFFSSPKTFVFKEIDLSDGKQFYSRIHSGTKKFKTTNFSLNCCACFVYLGCKRQNEMKMSLLSEKASPPIPLALKNYNLTAFYAVQMKLLCKTVCLIKMWSLKWISIMSSSVGGQTFPVSSKNFGGEVLRVPPVLPGTHWAFGNASFSSIIHLFHLFSISTRKCNCWQVIVNFRKFFLLWCKQRARKTWDLIYTASIAG